MGADLRVAVLIAIKDLRQRVRDRSAILASIVAPLGLAIIFSALLGNATGFHARYAVANLDGGQLAAVLRTDVIGGLATAKIAEITDAATRDEALALVTNGKADAAFVIPAGFTAAISAGKAATLEIAGARNATLETEVARAVAERFGEGVVAVQLAVATASKLHGSPLDGPATGAIVTAASAATPAITLTDDVARLRQLSMSTYFSASMAILFLFFSAQIGIVSLFDERRAGTLARILAGPVRPWSVLFGKLLAGFAMGAVSLTVLVTATTLAIGADWGPPLGVALIALGAIIAAIGITTLVASFARTGESAAAAGSAVAITLGVLGGSFTMSTQSPDAMATLALFTPHGWFLRGLAELHGAGATPADALPAAGVLLAMGAVTLTLGLLRARKLVSAR